MQSTHDMNNAEKDHGFVSNKAVNAYMR